MSRRLKHILNQEEKGSDRELFEYGIELRNSNKMSTLKYKSGAQKRKMKLFEILRL